MIKILICILLIGEIQFVHKKGTNNDGVQVKNTEFVENGIFKYSIIKLIIQINVEIKMIVFI